jgi:hypothetical protein
MDFDTPQRSSETQDSKINIYNVVLSNVIEMNEYRSELFTTVQMTGVTPNSYKDFIRTFFKLFTLTQSMLPQKMRNEIQSYFINEPKKSDPLGTLGIKHSLGMQKELENQRMITLYEETIVPPFVEPSDDETDDEVPEILTKKSVYNPVTKRSYPLVERSEVLKGKKKIQSLFKSKGGKK